jgi:hypothetical protein
VTIVIELIVTLALIAFAFFAKDDQLRATVINVVVGYWFAVGGTKVRDKAKSNATTDPGSQAEES